jgi:hypothetical protein
MSDEIVIAPGELLRNILAKSSASIMPRSRPVVGFRPEDGLSERHAAEVRTLAAAIGPEHLDLIVAAFIRAHGGEGKQERHRAVAASRRESPAHALRHALDDNKKGATGRLRPGLLPRSFKGSLQPFLLHRWIAGVLRRSPLWHRADRG